MSHIDYKMITDKKPYIYPVLGQIVSVWVLLFFFVTVSNAQTIIIQQPQSVTVCAATKAATFTVGVNPVYTDAVYQWYEWDGSQFVQISVNSTNSSYTATKAGQYRCVVYVQSNSKQETSATATLSYINVPSATGIEAPAVCNKTDLHAKALGVAANGSDITHYEWKLGTTIKASGPVSGNTVPDLITYVDSTQHRASLKIILTNGCGRDSVSMLITVNATPAAPTVTSRSSYCRDDTPEPLAIAQENATWYTQRTGGTGTTVAPVPSMDVFTPQTWWVSQTINYGTVSCEGYRAEATVIVRPRSPYPTTNTDVQYCLNDAGTTLGAQGQNVKWYAENGNELPSAPQINTSVAGTQTYYVTQTVPGACESLKLKVTVTIKDRADESLISIPAIPTQCPYNAVTIQASANVTAPVFRWYRNNDKSDIPYVGNPFVTPALTVNTTYYVTLEYAGHCESLYPQTVIITVEDVEKPTIVAPENVVVSTNDGVCYATNVQTGRPVVSDNCTPADKLNVFISPAPPAQYPLGSTTITWWVADTVHNTEKAVQSITVKDMEFPKGTCPDDIEIVVNDDVTSAVVDYNMSYTDNCGVVKITRTSGLESGSVFPLGETIVAHEIADTAGNVSVCRFKVLVRHPYRPLEIVALRVSPGYEICSGQAVTITPVVSGGTGKYTYSWSPRPWTHAVLEDYPLVTTRYELTVNDGVTSRTKGIDITVLEVQPVKLEYDGRMDEIMEGDEVVVEATSGFASYKFLLNNEVMQEVGLNNQLAFMAELGTYIVRVFATDINYCVAQDQLEIYVESKRLPNVFTPNQDGKNEIFLQGFDLMVFSRAGELLYKGTDGWTGFYKGKPLPQGTYLYVVRRTMNNGEFRVYKGTVTLKR